MKVIIRNLSVEQADSFLIMLENNNSKISILLDGNCENMANERILLCEVYDLDQLDYIVVTHIDNDHLGGILKVLEANGNDKKLANTKIVYNFVTQKNISFNQAKRFEKIIKGRSVIKSYGSKYDSDDFLYFLSINDRKICNDIESESKAFITFLSPTREGANKVWENFNDGQKENAELINDNSIVFMLEAGEKRAIFAGDANWDKIEKQLEKVFGNENYIVDLIKVPHHGADHNNIGLENFVAKHNCKKLLITGKTVWDHEHPDEELIKKLKALSTINQLEIYSKVNLTTYFEAKDEEIKL